MTEEGDKRTRVALLEEGRLMEIYYGHPSHEKLVGNIYRGRVEDVLPGLGSAFVDVGERKSLFLSQSEINDPYLIEKGFKPWQSGVPINKLLRPGQFVTLQVRRDGIGSKNPQGTMKISLPGRFWVYLPTEDRLGVSRRVESVRDQRRIRRVARTLKRDGEGMIARTAAQWANDEELERDYHLLVETWECVVDASKTTNGARLLYKAMGLVQTVLRDRLGPEISEVVVDSPFFYEKIVSFLDYMQLSEFKDRIQLHKGSDPLFAKHNVEQQIQDSLSRRVPLAGGGSLVIDETEALIAIDVNTGGDVRHRNQEAAILNTNLEAATEIARQLRLRQISGIIVVDFVDMEDPTHIEQVTDRVKEELKKDRVSADFVDMTALGLVEITRKRRGESLADMLENAKFDA
ncbi:MAG: Rne/Rng family ribonuclease [Candidatus Bipolaricaulota bacterium]|nr:Rne/Rng family ribonuclease [Candidatus Bipolaricaulota bacterium]